MPEIDRQIEMQEAALNCSVDLVRQLGPNRLDSDGYSPLMLLLLSDVLFKTDPEIDSVLRIPLDETMIMGGVRTLLSAGADVRFNADGITALSIAKKKGYDSIVALLEATEREQANKPMPSPQTAPTSSGCIIATACLGDDRVAPLRKLRDDAITSDPIARDFFHVFWSRYYEWSPGVARIASQDPAVAEHIRWGFLDPWLAWLEFASVVGQCSVADLSDDERREILQRLGARLASWLAELPTLMEGKCPTDASQVFEAFERFRASAQSVFSA